MNRKAMEMNKKILHFINWDFLLGWRYTIILTKKKKN